MCGIAGIAHFNSNPVKQDEIELLTESIKHRGPDGVGYWVNNKQNVSFGHARLSILDLSPGGRQPMGYLNNRYHITLNGEIYNFIEIKEELINKGYKFTTESDTEVLLAAYHECGIEVLNRLNGMWAFAIYDELDDSLILSRDRFGVKPLYYHFDGKRLVFSSEVQAIHKLLGNNHPLDSLVIKDIANGSFISHGTERTYLKGVYSLPGGFNLILKEGKFELRQWYILKKTKVPGSFKEQAAILKVLITDACRLRLRSDVSIGTCLSGGVDSGSITAVINNQKLSSGVRFNKYTHRGFCASFPFSPIDESEDARALASKLGSSLDIVNINPPSKAELEEAMKQCDGPMHALAFYPIWKLYKYIKEQDITVTLDGQGPDEMLGGYRPVYEALQAAVQLRKPFWFHDVYKTYAAQGESSQFSSIDYAKAARKRILYSLVLKPITKIKSLLQKLLKTEKPILTVEPGDFLEPVNINKQPSNYLDNNLFVQFFQHPLPGILNQYDRCSMAHGVECRMPFMDYRVVEFVFSLPVESKVGNGYTKRILREAMKDILPDETRLNKRKIGFNAPIVDWFNGPLKEFMLEIMNSREFLDSEYFDGKQIRQSFRNFLNLEKPLWNTAWQFWPPVHLTWWIKQNNII